MKEQILQNLKAQWKKAVEGQFAKEPDKVINANLDKNANEIMSNPLVKINAKLVGITKEDVVRILSEIRDEVCK